jgi:hypothetical protein
MGLFVGLERPRPTPKTLAELQFTLLEIDQSDFYVGKQRQKLTLSQGVQRHSGSDAKMLASSSGAMHANTDAIKRPTA